MNTDFNSALPPAFSHGQSHIPGSNHDTGMTPLLPGHTHAGNAGVFVQPHLDFSAPFVRIPRTFDAALTARWNQHVADNDKLGSLKLRGTKFAEFVKQIDPQFRRFTTMGLANKFAQRKAPEDAPLRGPTVTTEQIEFWEQMQLENAEREPAATRHQLLQSIYSDPTHTLYTVHPGTLEKHLIPHADDPSHPLSKPGVSAPSGEEERGLMSMFEKFERTMGQRSEVFYFKTIQNKHDGTWRQLADINWQIIRARLTKFRRAEAMRLQPANQPGVEPRASREKQPEQAPAQVTGAAAAMPGNDLDFMRWSAVPRDLHLEDYGVSNADMSDALHTFGLPDA